MGTRYEFKCAKCGYGAEVSGGGDAGMDVATTTILCVGCMNLQDVVIHELKGRGDRPLRCTKRAGHEVRRWEAPWPCPRCGTERMQKGDLVMLWD